MSFVVIDLHARRHCFYLMVFYFILQMPLQLFCVQRLIEVALVKRDGRCTRSRMRPSSEGAHDRVLLNTECSLANLPLAELVLILSHSGLKTKMSVRQHNATLLGYCRHSRGIEGVVVPHEVGNLGYGH